MPTTLTPTWGVSLQIPIYAGFGIYGSYTRLTATDPNKTATLNFFQQKYPITNPMDPGFVFPRTADTGFFWGNQVFTLGITYKIYDAGNFAFDIGAGWSGFQALNIIPVLRDNGLVFQEQSGLLQYQGASLFALAYYKLSKEFSLQGKCSLYGLTRSSTPALSEREQQIYPLTHGALMVGISFHPF